MHLLIRHITKFRYSAPISESVSEVRLQPRTDATQRCLSFDLHTSPRGRPAVFRDYLGNIVHTFDVPRHHTQLTIATKCHVETFGRAPLPESLGHDPWEQVDLLCDNAECCDMLLPSRFTEPTPLLNKLAEEFGVERRVDPLQLLLHLNSSIYRTFEYVPDSTEVDSPIDHALELRRGVCQDYSHIMLALLRQVRIPCRYVSGYLFHRTEDGDRSASDATHAWIEAYLPQIGWIGLDPTNNLVVNERHIRVAIGRDYADVPPNRGVHKGAAGSELSVAVKVTLADDPVVADLEPAPAGEFRLPENAHDFDLAQQYHRQQMQQQQQ